MKRPSSSEVENKQPIVYERDQHNISRKDIDPDAIKIMYRLIHAGYKAYLVGGGVRDLLLGKPPKDFDIGTDATPRRIKTLFRNSRIIGRRFKLVHIYFRGNKIIEVSTFRDESEGEVTEVLGKQTDNVYGDESTDAQRRDLTINGLFYDLSTFSVIDYAGGMQDLRDGIIRVIGDPDLRFKQDPVRLMRVVRHAARNNFAIEPNTWESLLRNRDLIVKSSQVRVYEELRKDLVSGHFLDILKLLVKSGLIDYLLPVVSERHAELFTPSHPFSKIIKKIDAKDVEADSTTVVLAVITLLLISIEGDHDLEDSVKKLFTSLAVPRRERERIVVILESLQDICRADLSKVKVQALVRRPHFKELLQVSRLISDHLIAPEVAEFLEQAALRAERGKPRERRTRYINRQRSLG